MTVRIMATSISSDRVHAGHIRSGLLVAGAGAELSGAGCSLVAGEADIWRGIFRW
ncbi:hypothetical protein LBMAG46_16550 [Planctomycetia bacterium]|nr:hypothetical protein LBMAG46_16550 [Planctomycetia bacterium]